MKKIKITKEHLSVLQEQLQKAEEISKQLRLDNKQLKEENSFLKAIIFNPPVFKVGEKVGNNLIVHLESKSKNNSLLLNAKFLYNVTAILLSKRPKYLTKEILDDVNSNNVIYEYEVFDMRKNHKLRKTESELITIFKENENETKKTAKKTR